MAARIAARLLRGSASRASSSKHLPIPSSSSSSRVSLIQTSPSSPRSCAFSHTVNQQSPNPHTSPAASPSHWVHPSPFVASTRQIVRSFAIRSATSSGTTRISDNLICFTSTSQRRWVSSASGKGPDVATKASEADTEGGEVIGEGEQAGEEAGEAEWGTYRDRRVAVRSFSGEARGEAVLDGTIFDVPVRRDIVHRVVCWQLAKRRQGTHSTKRACEVRGSSKKPWKQKGTGRARHGSRRGPQFRGGATMHGPKPRSHAFSLNKKVRALGLKAALSARLREGQLVLYSDLNPGSPKTKDMAQHVATAFPDSKKILFVDGSQRADETLLRASGNLHYVNVLPVVGLNVYSIVQHDALVLSLPALQALEHRLLSAKRQVRPGLEERLDTAAAATA
ncbi:unnamed protein product [Closterium sp. Yama58-4]|nr:unnamed protein product [Closterium sp. Yama58-4]